MDIVIGKTTPIGNAGKRDTAAGDSFPVTVLDVRSARKDGDTVADSGDRRKGSDAIDPHGGKVLVLLVADGYRLPADLAKRDYRLVLKILPPERKIAQETSRRRVLSPNSQGFEKEV